VSYPLPAPLLAGVLAVGAVWGDLLESLLKRGAGVKDAGRALQTYGPEDEVDGGEALPGFRMGLGAMLGPAKRRGRR